MALKDWHPGKIGLLWGLSLAVLAVLVSLASRWDRLTALIIWFLLTLPLVILTWRWFGARERPSARAPELALGSPDYEAGGDSQSTEKTGVVERPAVANTKTTIGFIERLRTPAPKSEKSGYIAVILFLAIPVLAVIIALLSDMAKGYLTSRQTDVLIYIVAFGILIGFALVKREPWAYWVLFAALWLVWMVYVWGAATNSSGLDSPQAGGAAWWATFNLLVIASLYRRRWWFGVDVPASVIKKTPDGGRLVLFFLALVWTVIVVAFVQTIAEMR
jgi:hypothetical protein